MKNKIKEILSVLEIENVDEIVDKIAKEVALLTVPKDTYNDLSDKLKTTKSEKKAIEDELEDLKSKNLSEDEKIAKERETLEKKTKALSIELNKAKAREIFQKANLSEEKMEELLNKVVSDDEKTTLGLANSFAEILKTQEDNTRKKAEEDLLNKTPKPSVKETGNEPKKYTKEDFMNMSYGEKKALLLSDEKQYNELLSEVSTSE